MGDMSDMDLISLEDYKGFLYIVSISKELQ